MTARPEIILLTNVPTPYRVALHRRLDEELPEVRILTVYTHDAADQPWMLKSSSDASERVFKFGVGDRSIQASDPSRALIEWRKGGRIIDWIKSRKQMPAALLLSSYNDPGRLRILRWATTAMESAGRPRIPTFLVGDSNIHGDLATGLKAIVKRQLVSWVISRCAGVMPCGSYGEEAFVKYGAARDRVFYFPYEPDYAMIENVPKSTIENVRRRWGLKPERKHIVCCSRMIEVKRPDIAVDAFTRIAKERPDWDLVVIGDGPLTEATRARVPEELRDRVKLTGFLGDQQQISAIYKMGDIFFHPSIFEPWGVVINEAVCAGMAVVCSNTVGAAGELVKDGVNGRLFAPGDLGAATEALRDAADPRNLSRYRAQSREVLADWRRRGDPVEGLRAALESCGCLGRPQLV